MGTNLNNTQLNILYKKYLGVANTDTIKDPSIEYSIDASPNISLKKIYTQEIPSTAPDLSSVNIFLQPGSTFQYGYKQTGLYPYNYIIKYTNIQLSPLYGNSNFSFVYDITDGEAANDENASDNILSNTISSKYDPKGSYRITVIATSDNQAIYPADYILDRDAGVLTIYNDAINRVSKNTPPRITFWRYEGTKGAIGGSSTWSSVAATSDVYIEKNSIYDISNISVGTIKNISGVDLNISTNKNIIINSTGNKVILNSILELSGNRISKLADPSDASDAISKGYLDTRLNGISGISGNFLNLSGGTMAGSINMSGSDISNVNNIYSKTLQNISGNDLSLTSSKNIVLSSQTNKIIFGSLLDVSSSRITRLADPSDISDAISKGYLDTRLSNISVTGNYLNLSGGTMAGAINMSGSDICGVNNIYSKTGSNLILSSQTNKIILGSLLDLSSSRIIRLADPSDVSDAVNKAYVDKLRSDISSTYLSLSGGTMAGSIYMNSQDISNANILSLKTLTNVGTNSLNISGSNNIVLTAQNIIFNSLVDVSGKRLTKLADPSDVSDATNKAYVDKLRSDISSAYLSLSGGTMNGSINMGAKDISNANALQTKSVQNISGNDLTITSSKKIILGASNNSIVFNSLLDLSGKRLTKLADPSDVSDAINKGYLESKLSKVTNLTDILPSADHGSYIYYSNDGTNDPVWQIASDNITLGINAGKENPSYDIIAIGPYTSSTNSSDHNYTISIGSYTNEGEEGDNVDVQDSQNSYAISIGRGAGQTSQGRYSIAMGYKAGMSNQGDNTIILNATGSTLDNSGATSGFYVKPIRDKSTVTNDIYDKALYYNEGSGEITFGSIASGGGGGGDVSGWSRYPAKCNVDMSNYFITNLLDIPDVVGYNSYAVNKKYVDCNFFTKTGNNNLAGSITFTGLSSIIDLSNTARIINVPNIPGDGTDAVNSNFVNSNLSNWSSYAAKSIVDICNNFLYNLRDISFSDLSKNTYAVNKKYVDDIAKDLSGRYLSLSGGTIAGSINMSGSDISNVNNIYSKTLQNTGIDDLSITSSKNIVLSSQTNKIIFGSLLDLSSNRITRLADPSDISDAISKGYLDTRLSNISVTGNYLNLSGGTMSGAINMSGFDICGVNNIYSKTSTNLIISAQTNKIIFGSLLDLSLNRITRLADPSDVSDAVSKAYVDKLRTDISSSYLSLSGGTMTGAIYMSGKDISNANIISMNTITNVGTTPLNISGSNNIILSAQTNRIILNSLVDLSGKRLTKLADPSDLSDATNKSYVDKLRSDISSVYLSLSGGTMTGSIIMGGNKITGLSMTAADLSNVATTKGYVDAQITEAKANAVPKGVNYSDYLYYDSDISGWKIGSITVNIGTNAGKNKPIVNGVPKDISGSVSIGAYAGENYKDGGSISIGYSAGNTSQNIYSTSIGAYAGESNQRDFAIAIGYNAGNTSQVQKSIAIGTNAGRYTLGEFSIAIGDNAGYQNSGKGSIAIGAQAGETAQGYASIAIGALAGRTSQPANSIILNASGTDISGQTFANAFYANPIRSVVGAATSAKHKLLYWNTDTGEICISST
jgi:hypothetical protein